LTSFLLFLGVFGEYGVPKTMKTKAELLVRKMKADPNIAWSEKGELKYKGETVRGSNVVDLVNDLHN
jgi:hypothetical protein